MLYHRYLQRVFSSHLFLFLFLRMETSKSLWTLCASIWPPSQNKIVFLCSDGVFCISVCPHCPWSCYRASLEKPGSVSFRYIQTLIRFLPSCLFSRSSCPISLSLLSHICSSFLGSLRYVHVSFVVGNPGLYPAIQMCHISAEQSFTDQPVFSLHHCPFILPMHYQFVNDDIMKDC